MIKGYVGTLMNIPESVKMAERCIETGKQFGIDVEMFPAVWKDISFDEMDKEGLELAKFDTTFSSISAVVGNFIAQYRIWTEIFYSKESGIVLEHDAVFIGSIPDLTGKGDIINIGKPSYGKFRSMTTPGVYPMFSKTGGYIPGAHGYYLTPEGAQQLIMKARTLGATPVDLFLNKTNFPAIQELYPWVVEAKDEFTTIQKEKGCGAKHNYNENYKIIE
jgi:hypothetical protein